MSAGIERIIDLSEGDAHLRVENEQLVVDREGEESKTIPMEEVAVVIAAHPRLTFTHGLLSLLASKGGVLVVCNERSLPVSLCLPWFGHSQQAQRLHSQIKASLPLKKRLWQKLVQAKIKNQASALNTLRGEDGGLGLMVNRVRSGDPENIESQAARRYWPLLVKQEPFNRDPEGEPPNHLFNYGYAVLRAIVARAICGSSLNPTLGLHHHHRDNSFCLADDLMEPFRPLVDIAAGRMLDKGLGELPLTRLSKSELLAPLFQRYLLEGEHRTLFDILSKTTASLAHIFADDSVDLLLPDLIIE